VNPSLSLRGRSLSVGGDFTCSAAEIRNSLNVDGDIVAEGGLSAGWMVRCENFKGLRLHGGWGVDIKENIDVKDHINAGCGLRVGGHVYVSSDIGWVNAEHAIYVGGDLMATAIRAGRSVHAKTISCRRVMAGASVSLPLREEHKQIRAILLSGEVQLGKLIDAQCEQQDRTGERIMILDNQRYRLTPVTS
jgi:hypothetical protein